MPLLPPGEEEGTGVCLTFFFIKSQCRIEDWLFRLEEIVDIALPLVASIALLGSARRGEGVRKRLGEAWKLLKESAVYYGSVDYFYGDYGSDCVQRFVMTLRFAFILQPSKKASHTEKHDWQPRRAVN